MIKKIFVFFLCFLHGFFLVAQEQKDNCNTGLIRIVHWNILYPRENVIAITPPNHISLDSCTVHIEGNATLEKLSCGNFLIYVTLKKITDPENLKEYDSRICWIVLKNLKGETIHKERFVIANFPPPDAWIGHLISSGKIEISEFRQQKYLSAALDHFYTNQCDYCKILEFKTVRIGFDNSAETVINTGGKFSEETQKLLQKATKGDRYIFFNIISNCNTINNSESASLVFEIISD